jgi:hypothetical protein
VIVDDCLLATIFAGMPLVGANLRAVYALHRGFEAAQYKKVLVQHELHTNRLTHREIDEPIAALRNHQYSLSKESAICPRAESPSYVYSKNSADAEIARHTESLLCPGGTL